MGGAHMAVGGCVNNRGTLVVALSKQLWRHRATSGRTLMTRSDLLGRSGIFALIGYLAVWAAATAYIGASGGDWTFPFISLVIFGLIFSAVIWFVTRRMDAPQVPVARPRQESLVLLGYITIYAVLLIGIWLGTIKQAVPPGPNQKLVVLGYKLLIHVALPAGLIVLLGGTLRPL